MGKRILIGSMLVLILLLLMPSIPAIQQKTIEDRARNDLVERLEDFNFKDVKEIKILGDDIKHPLLFRLVSYHFYLLYIRAEFLIFISVIPGLEGPDLIIFPLIYMRASYLIGKAIVIFEFWNHISDTLGWGWFED